MRAVAVIPAHNEADRISATVTAASSIPGVQRVIVVDDASSDDTARLAAEAGADVVRLERNLGKGLALRAGVAAAADGFDAVLLLDGDLGETAAEGASLLGPVERGQADMTVATFPRPAAKAGFGLVMGLARWGISTFGSKDFAANAPISGQRALTPKAIAALPEFGRGYGAEVDMTIRVLRAGLRVVEVPTTMTHAATGRDLAGFAHRGRQFAHVAAALLRIALSPPPRR